MAMSRYTIRNEYSLADPELYKSADKDDPEALLEGVAMAGLVGVLRQLGDLAQFAAEVFHNLHEEVMATSARGHSLKARVQQLEVEFPLIEKALLSQTNHSGFFYTAGIDWHPNVHIGQNYITRGDLPRFIMDSYEEARAPPRLFLLDKFDVAGAGACLKRFTDPSFYKVEASPLGITNADVQRDKKVRKGKRRGVRWRNGETPEVQSTTQAKLHQLLLEERIENSTSDPAHRVKLKRRLNGFPFDLKTGKSYMDKILRTPPPDYRELHEVRNVLPLKLLDNNFMPQLENDDFGSESPGVELSHRSQFSSPDVEDGVQNVSMREMEFRTSNESNHFKPEFKREDMGLKSPDLLFTHRSPPLAPSMMGSVPNIMMDEQEIKASGIESTEDLEVSNITSTLYDGAVEKQIMVDTERRSEGSSFYQSDDVVSEQENYMDALVTVEPEMDSDSELRVNSNLELLTNRKRISALDAATPLRQAHFSDSQSMGSNTLSDDGNSSFKKCKSSSSYSGSPRILAIKAYLEDELSDELDSSNDTGEAKRISSPLKWRGRTRNAGGSKVAAIPPYSSDDVKQTSSDTDVSPGGFAHRDADASVNENGVSQLKLGEMLSAEGVPGAEPSKDTGSEIILNLNLPSDSTSCSTLQKTEYDSLFRVVAENHSSDDEDDALLTESSSMLPITPDDTVSTGGSKDQHMEELVDKNMYLLQDVTPASCTSDGAPLNFEKYHSSFPKFLPLNKLANDNTRMSEHPSKPLPEELSENGLHEDLPNDDSRISETTELAYDNTIISEHPSKPSPEELSENRLHEDLPKDEPGTHEMSQPSLENMSQAGGGEHDFDAYPEVNLIDSQISIMLPAAEPTLESRLPELENDIREIDAPMTDILQPLDLVDSSMDNQIEEQFPHISDKQFLDKSLSEVEDCSDGSDHNVIIPGGSTMSLPAGEIAVYMEDQTLSGIPKGGEIKDIQTPVVLDSVPQPDVEFSDNRGEILPEPPSLVVRVVTDVAPARETDLGTVSPSVKPEIFVLNEMNSSVTADDMLLLDGARVETSSYQMENLHDLPRLEGEKLEGVSSSTDLGERADTVVEGSRVVSSLYGVDAEVPFSVSYNELNTGEKENIQKVQSMNSDHSESRILYKLSNSHSESESSLHDDITASSTLEQSGSYVNEVFAEKNTLDDDTVDALSVPIFYDVDEPKVNLRLQLLDAEGTEEFRTSGESNIHSNVTDSSALEQSEFSSKWVLSEKSVYTQDASPMSIPHDVVEKEVKLPTHQLDEEKNEVSTVEGESTNVLLEPRPTKKAQSDILLDHEGISGVASSIFSSNLPGQHSDSELLPQEKLKIDDVDQHNKPLGSIYPAFGLLPEAVNTDLVEIPPLPPLPPVQWRIGKIQPARLGHETAVLPNDNILFPSKSVADHSAQAPKLIVPSLVNTTDTSLLTIPDTSVQDCPSSLQMPISVNHANISHLQSLGGMQHVDQNLPFPGSNSNLLSLGELQLLNNNLPVPENCADLADVTEFRFPSQDLVHPANNSPSLSETQLLYGDLPLPTKLDEMPRHDDHTSTSSNATSSGTNGDVDAACDVELVVDSATLVQFNKAQETSPNNILGQGSASSESNSSTHDASTLLTKVNGEQPHNMMLTVEGEAAWPAQDEGNPYGVRPIKPPRQRNPLIDAVIALDKSKLRKVAERPKTQIQKVDERDSVFQNLQLRKVTEQPRIHIPDERDSVLENLKLRKVTEHPRTQIQKADEGDSVLENLQLRKVTEHPRKQIQKADEGDSVLENLKLRKVTEQSRTQIQKGDESDSVLENLQLRKVTEPSSTQIQKTDERDSLLEQIRSKTFNLKPSMVSRPAIQGPSGPTTSLKVAAILEKAKTMRQAFAGSDDDDDDDDSWSDS